MNYPEFKPTITITDCPQSNGDGFLADPFIIEKEGGYYMFFEELSEDPEYKKIGCSRINDETEWKYVGTALENNQFGFSFPFVFEHDSVTYMLPEMTDKNNRTPPLQLFKASSFPLNWEPVMDYNVRGVDSLLFQWNNIWYLISHDKHSAFDSFENRLYYSTELLSKNWEEHPESPIASNRMGGGPVTIDGRLFLFYQGGSHYGEKVWCCEVEKLTKSDFIQTKLGQSPIVHGQYNNDWNHSGMHHIDYTQDGHIAVVDGKERDSGSFQIRYIESNDSLIDEEIKRLTPAPDEFNQAQKIRMKSRHIQDRKGYIKLIKNYHSEKGTLSLVNKGLEKIKNII